MPRQKRQRLKCRPDGRFCCRYRNLFFYGATDKEALAARDQYKRDEAAGELAMRSGLTVGTYALKWLPLHKGSVSEKCYADYAKQIEALLDAIGNLPLADVTPDDAAGVWKHYAKYSASTVKRARMLFISLFDTAIENELCRRNPFRQKSAQPPAAPSGTHRVLTQEEVFLICSTPHRFQLAALIMLYCGLRRGEVLALGADDIDTAAGTITVSKAVRFDGNHAVLTMPKTKAGLRIVPILKPLRSHLNSISGLVAPSASGAVMTAVAFKRAWDSYLHALSRAAGHPVRFRPHDLRHTYCTMLRDAGIDMHQAMLWLGHSDEKMILRVYDHITEKRTAQSVKIANKFALRSQNGSQSSAPPPEPLSP